MKTERPKPLPFSRIDFYALYTKLIGLSEETLDDLDEGFDPETFEELGNENEDILEDNKEPIYEAVLEAIYGKEYWDYFNERV